MTSTYYLQPEIDTWQTKLEPFKISFVAYDNDGRRITRKQLYIKYCLTTDNTTPDLENNGVILYSNKDGVIELELNQKCRISIDLYAVPFFDDTIAPDDEADNYEIEHICKDLLLPFEAFIDGFTVSYKSNQDIPVNSSVPRKYIQIWLHKTDDSTAVFTIENELYNSYIVTPSIISHTGENTITISYFDTVLNKNWEYDIIVYGKLQELSMSAIYNGEKKVLNNLITKNDITVTMMVFDGIEEFEIPLSRSDWEFGTFPQITNSNLGHLMLVHNDLKCELVIPFEWTSYKYRLDAWYEGLPVRLGKTYIPDDFRIYLYKEDGTRDFLEYTVCNISPESKIVTKKGINWFTVVYRVGAYTLRDKVAIIGYDEIEYEQQEEHKLYYLDKGLKTFVDVTKDYKNACEVGGKVYFSWSKILNMISYYEQYGIFKLYAPIHTGLSTKCDTEWIITCNNDKSIKSMLIKEHLTRRD